MFFITKEEFFAFNLQSQLQLLKWKGVLLIEVWNSKEIRCSLYRFGDFFTEMKQSNGRILSIDPHSSGTIPDYFLNTIRIEDFV